MDSWFETVAGELRARLLRQRRGLATIPVAAGTAPVTWHCTRYVALHPIRTGAMPTDRVHRTTLEYPKEESAAPHASPTDRNTRSHKTPKHRRCGGRRRVRRARLRCPWAVAGPGRTTSRRAERSSRRGRLAGGPPPTGTQSSPARRTARAAPRTPVGPQASRPTGTHSGRTQRRPAARGHTKPPDPTGAGRLRQSARETQRRITTMSGSPRPLS